jgi:hypothetical protein
MNSSLVEEAKPADIVNLEENTIEKETQAVKILLEIREFEKEMDAVEEVSFEHSSRIDNSKMLLGKNENEQTPLKNNISPSSNIQIIKEKVWVQNDGSPFSNTKSMWKI